MGIMSLIANKFYRTPEEPVAEPAEQKAASWDIWLPGMLPGNDLRSLEGTTGTGYYSNPYAYRAINLIAEGVGKAEWELDTTTKTTREDSLNSHPLIQLLKRPNDMSGTRLMGLVMTHLLLAGDAYILQLGPNPKLPPRELHVLRPDKIKISTNSLGAAIYTFDGKYEYDASQVLHLSTLNPEAGKLGIPTIRAAASSIAFNNAARDWNSALLKNGGKVSGALVGKTQTDAQFNAMKEMLRQEYGGSANAGRLMAIPGDVDFKQFSLDPTDADWLSGQQQSVRDVAVVFGVPSTLLQDPAASTYANYESSIKFFYATTISTWLTYLRDELNAWLVPMYPDKNIYLDYCLDELAEDENAQHEDARKSFESGVMTRDEARAILGLQPLGGTLGAELVTPRSATNPVSNAG